MSHAKNKIEWCLKKGEEQKEGKHRGLIKIKPNLEEARKHIEKAEHYLGASDYLNQGNYSDISASTLFYSMYHCLLAIAQKFGYDSGNQECTFALIYNLIEEGKISIKKELIEKISSFELKSEERTSIEIREIFQYGTSLSLDAKIYNEMILLAREVLSKTKKVLEE